MSENHIKYVVVGRPLDAKILGGEAPYSIKKTLKMEYTESVQEILDQIGQQSAYPDLRDDQETIYGAWYSYCDHNCLSYHVLTSNTYKKNIAFDLLRKLSKKLYEAYPEMQSKYSEVPILDIKDLVDDVCMDYENPRNLDKLSQAQQEVQKTTGIM